MNVMSRVKVGLFIVAVICLNGLIAGIAYVNMTPDVQAADQHGVEWGYEGEIGPDNWANLSPEFAACGEGQAQSPIDINDTTLTKLIPLGVAYEQVPLAIFNNGHTIEVEYEEGSYLTYNAKQYNVLQFHFHQPSEHLVNGEPAAMELHIVHQEPNSGQLAVVGVLMVEGDEFNEAYATVFDHLPAEVGEPAHDTDLTVNVADLLPADTRHYYTYEGSLTTPPCSEVVRWIVMTDPVELSAEQLAAFGEIYDMNARPAMPLNERNLFANQQ